MSAAVLAKVGRPRGSRATAEEDKFRGRMLGIQRFVCGLLACKGDLLSGWGRWFPGESDFFRFFRGLFAV